MRARLTAAFAFTCATLLAQTAQHYPHASYSLTEYAPPASVTPAILAWIAARFDWIVGATTQGDPHGAFGARVHVQAYTDSAVVYQGQMYDVQALADANGWSLEGMMLHGNQDVQYNVAGGYQKWTNMHQFDAFEQANTSPNPGAYTSARNGVFVFDGAQYTDVTVASFAGAPGVGGAAASIAIPSAGALYVGYMEPFDQMNFAVATPRVGGVLAWQYWNGSTWATLVNLSDNTNGLTTSGQLYWPPPSDWAQTIVNGSKLKYWVRTAPSGAWTTAPVYSALYGDDWSVASGTNNARGWASVFNAASGTWADAAPPCPENVPTGTSCIVNAGTRLRYNASPPAGASAHFPYQARVSDIYYANPNEMFGNPSNVQGGRVTWGDWLAHAWQAQAAVFGSYYDATFFDDVGGIPLAAIASPANFAAGLDYNQNLPFPQIVATELMQVRASLRSLKGASFAIGINGGTAYPVPYAVDTSQQEGYGITTWVPYPVYEDAVGSNQTYLKMDDTLTFGAPQYVGLAFANGLNDLTYTGTYTGTPTLYCVQITGNAPDTYSVGTAITFAYFGACNNVSTGNVITGSAQSIGAGLALTFGATAGHTVGDLWYFESQAQNRGGANAQFTCWDSAQFWGPGLNASAWHYPDLANRTPMLCLAQYYLGWNANTGLYYTTYTYGNLDEVYTYAPATAIAAPLAPGATTLQLADVGGCAPLPVYGNLIGVRVGTPASGDTVFGALANGVLTVYVGQIGNAWPAGASARCIVAQHQSAIATPPVASVYRWASWFPAMAVDLGAPDAAGVNHGYRMGPEVPWARAASFSPNANVTDVFRRDFTGGVVFMRPWAYPGSWNEVELDAPPSAFAGGHAVCIAGTWPNCTGGPWYRLAADGTTGAATRSVDLREADAAIMLRAPVVTRRGFSLRGGVVR